MQASSEILAVGRGDAGVHGSGGLLDSMMLGFDSPFHDLDTDWEPQPDAFGVPDDPSQSHVHGDDADDTRSVVDLGSVRLSSPPSSMRRINSTRSARTPAQPPWKGTRLADIFSPLPLEQLFVPPQGPSDQSSSHCPNISAASHPSHDRVHQFFTSPLPPSRSFPSISRTVVSPIPSATHPSAPLSDSSTTVASPTTSNHRDVSHSHTPRSLNYPPSAASSSATAVQLEHTSDAPTTTSHSSSNLRSQSPNLSSAYTSYKSSTSRTDISQRPRPGPHPWHTDSAAATSRSGSGIQSNGSSMRATAASTVRSAEFADMSANVSVGDYAQELRDVDVGPIIDGADMDVGVDYETEGFQEEERMGEYYGDRRGFSSAGHGGSSNMPQNDFASFAGGSSFAIEGADGTDDQNAQYGHNTVDLDASQAGNSYPGDPRESAHLSTLTGNETGGDAQDVEGNLGGSYIAGFSFLDDFVPEDESNGPRPTEGKRTGGARTAAENEGVSSLYATDLYGERGTEVSASYAADRSRNRSTSMDVTPRAHDSNVSSHSHPHTRSSSRVELSSVSSIASGPLQHATNHQVDWHEHSRPPPPVMRSPGPQGWSEWAKSSPGTWSGNDIVPLNDMSTPASPRAPQSHGHGPSLHRPMVERTASSCTEYPPDIDFLEDVVSPGRGGSTMGEEDCAVVVPALAKQDGDAQRVKRLEHRSKPVQVQVSSHPLSQLQPGPQGRRRMGVITDLSAIGGRASAAAMQHLVSTRHPNMRFNPNRGVWEGNDDEGGVLVVDEGEGDAQGVSEEVKEGKSDPPKRDSAVDVIGSDSSRHIRSGFEEASVEGIGPEVNWDEADASGLFLLPTDDPTLPFPESPVKPFSTENTRTETGAERGDYTNDEIVHRTSSPLAERDVSTVFRGLETALESLARIDVSLSASMHNPSGYRPGSPSPSVIPAHSPTSTSTEGAHPYLPPSPTSNDHSDSVTDDAILADQPTIPDDAVLADVVCNRSATLRLRRRRQSEPLRLVEPNNKGAPAAAVTRPEPNWTAIARECGDFLDGGSGSEECNGWLDLSGRGLETVAGMEAAVGEGVRNIRLDGNKLSYLRGVPRGVMDLSCVGNRLSSLTSFTHLMDLQWVDVSGNELSDLEALTHLRHLRTLIADRNHLHDISALRRMTSLVRCSLRSNQVRVVDFGSTRVAALEVLDLAENQLEEISGWEGMLGLREVVLGILTVAMVFKDKNRFTSFNAPLLPSLRVLSLARNRLVQVSVASVPGLRVLRLDGNRLKELSGLERCAELEVVELAEQESANLAGVEVRLLRSVQRLDLASNVFGSLELLADFSKLEHLDVSSCSLRGSLTKQFGKGTPNLLTLNLAHNKIVGLSSVKYLSRLKRLVVFDNEVTDFGETIKSLRNLRGLEELDLRYNPITRSFYAPVPVLSSSISDREKWISVDQSFKRTLSDVDYVRRLAYRSTIIAGTGYTLSILDGVPVTEREKKDSERRVAKLRERAEKRVAKREENTPSRSGTAMSRSQESDFLNGLRKAIGPGGYDAEFVGDVVRSAAGSAASSRGPFERSQGEKGKDHHHMSLQVGLPPIRPPQQSLPSSRTSKKDNVKSASKPSRLDSGRDLRSHLKNDLSDATSRNSSGESPQFSSERAPCATQFNGKLNLPKGHGSLTSNVQIGAMRDSSSTAKSFWVDVGPNVRRPHQSHQYPVRRKQSPPRTSDTRSESNVPLPSGSASAMSAWQPISYPLEPDGLSDTSRSHLRGARHRRNSSEERSEDGIQHLVRKSAQSYSPPAPGSLRSSNASKLTQKKLVSNVPSTPPPPSPILKSSFSMHGSCDFGHGEDSAALSSTRLSTPSSQPVEPIPAGAHAPISSVDPFTYCANLVRHTDYEHYLVSLLQPSPAARRTYWAIRALNIELAKIRESVSNDALGTVKMQWWRDSVEECFKGNPGNAPTLVALYQAIQRTPLSKVFFFRLIKERTANLSVAQYPTMASLELYAEHTASSLLYLHLQTLGVISLQADHAASHLGKALGIATVLRGAAWQARDRRWYLPAEVMAKVGVLNIALSSMNLTHHARHQHGVSQEAVFREGPSPALADAVLEIAALAHAHLRHARELVPTAPTQSLPAFLSLVPLERFLNRLEEVDFNLFDGRLYRKDWSLPAIMWWRSKRWQ
ncbi:NADH dehydrogenase (ubiquinone) complex I, assembly factor 6 [Gonapodya sp. JEL0774]|nr:NADH dehydrogenase (ubiquinone) complex I, assembly factor 6 [Gonapodya sp. JEL0774]